MEPPRWPWSGVGFDGRTTRESDCSALFLAVYWTWTASGFRSAEMPQTLAYILSLRTLGAEALFIDCQGAIECRAGRRILPMPF